MRNKLKLLVITGILLFFIGEKVMAQDIHIPNEKKTLALKFTADWCGPCGGWGWKWFDSMRHEYNNGTFKAIPVAVHISSNNADMNFTHYGRFVANFTRPMIGIPTFSIGHKSDVGMMDAMRDEVALQASKVPTVNTGFSYTISGDTMTVKTKTKFFYDSKGEHYVAVYIYEDDITSYQNPRGNNAEHHRVLREIPEEPVLGRKLPGSYFAGNSVFEDSLKFVIPASWNKKELHVFTVIWNKTDSNYVVANANDMSTFPTNASSVSNAINTIKVYPNPATNVATIKIHLATRSNVKISIVDQTGRTVYTESNDIGQGNNYIPINTSNLAAGVYSINIVDGEKVYNQQITINK